ncbi:MAG: phosphoglycolate phosphatase [Defluviicoccus sp.]|nr:MAG: phosphoglycolate phosphatase [Defluviicoccus sp.]
MSAITVVVFDLDGTLIDSAPDLRTALNSLLATEERRALTLDEVISIVGDGARVLVERALALTGGNPGQEEDAARLTRQFLDLYESRCSLETRAYPGVEETLDHLAGAGLSFGICTNKPEQVTRNILSDLGLNDRFSTIVGGDSLNGIRKPDPRPLLATLATLGAPPESAVMVGDSRNDITAARAAGMRVIYHAGGYGRFDPDLPEPDAAIADFPALPDAIRALS